MDRCETSTTATRVGLLHGEAQRRGGGLRSQHQTPPAARLQHRGHGLQPDAVAVAGSAAEHDGPLLVDLRLGRRDARQPAAGHVGGQVLMRDVAPPDLPPAAELPQAGSSTASTATSRPNSSSASSKALRTPDGIEAVCGLEEPVDQGVGDSDLALVDPGRRLCRRVATRDVIPHPTEIVEVVMAVAAVPAGTAPGHRNPVPPLPGPQRRGGHHQELTDVLDGQDGIRVETQTVGSRRVRLTRDTSPTHRTTRCRRGC